MHKKGCKSVKTRQVAHMHVIMELIRMVLGAKRDHPSCCCHKWVMPSYGRGKLCSIHMLRKEAGCGDLSAAAGTGQFRQGHKSSFAEELPAGLKVCRTYTNLRQDWQGSGFAGFRLFAEEVPVVTLSSHASMGET